MIAREWRLASATGAVYFFIVCNPGARIADIADGLGLTQRAVWEHTGTLIKGGLVKTDRDPANRKKFRYFDLMNVSPQMALMALKDRR